MRHRSPLASLLHPDSSRAARAIALVSLARTSPTARALTRKASRSVGRYAARRATDRLNRVGTSISPVGLLVGAAGFAASTQPTLIPRLWAQQGAVSGLSTVVGYAVGARTQALVNWAVPATRIPDRHQGVVRLAAGTVLAGVAVAALVRGAAGQRRLAELWQREPEQAHVVRALPTAAAFFAVPLALGRFAGQHVGAVRTLLGQRLPKPVADVVGDALYAWTITTLVRAGVNEALGRVVTGRYLQRDRTVPDGATPPVQAERSGSPASLQSWDSLGFEGRKFVALGPRAADITAFTGRPAKEPVRVYVGIGADVRHAEDADIAALAAAVVAELDRTEAWTRKVVVVVTPTGTGWIDGPAAASLEILHDGDTAVAGFQYSADPSWVQLVLNLTVPDRAGRALFEAVHARWSQLPADSRPLLVPFGLSLGSYGSQAPFRSLDDVRARTSGAVWAGTPRFTPLNNALTQNRDPGSTQIHPVHDGGRTARWGVGNGGAQGITDLGEAPGPRVAYLQHPSDAVTRWWWPAAWRRDDWFSEPAGQDVLPGIRWYPVVTGLQLFLDLMASDSTLAPPGFGHHYCEAYVDAWHWVTRVEGWDQEDLQRLRTAMRDISR